MIAERLKNINEYYFSVKLAQLDAMRQEGKQVINLGIGSPDLAPHESVIETLAQHSRDISKHAYQSYKGSTELRQAVEKWYSDFYECSLNSVTEILPIMGSKEGIMQICMTYVNEGNLVLVPDPGYPTYAAAATIAGANVQYFGLHSDNGWLPNFTEIDQILSQHRKVTQKQTLMFINYPNMPTGAKANEEDFDDMIAFARANDILLVHDNPYSFILNDKPLSMMSRPHAMEVCLELNSLSKSHNMAGWRIGFIIGAAARLTGILKFSSNMDSGMFLPMQLAAAEALALGRDWYAGLNQVYKKRRSLVFEMLSKLNCAFDVKQVGMFVWAKVPQPFKDGFELSDFILENSNVFITPGGIFGSNGNSYIRVSLCAGEEIFKTTIRRLENLKVKQ